MKVRFSYEKNFLIPVLGGSLLLHGLTFGLNGWGSLSPQYNVKSAPNSVEIVMVQEKLAPPKTEKVKEEAVLNIKKENPVLTPEVIESVEDQPKPKTEEAKPLKEEPMPQVLSSPIQGALTKAVPDGQKNKAPQYPHLARLRGWEGTVHLNVRVSPEGRAESVKISISSGQKILDQAAVRAVRNWHFKPAHVAGMPVKSTIEIPVRFVLENESRQ